MAGAFEGRLVGVAVEPEAPSKTAPDHYNKMLAKLVGDELEDIGGAIAYVIYKISKREWMKDICEKEGRLPTDPQIEAYMGSWTAGRLDGLRTEADQVLSAFAGYIISTERPKIVEEALKERSFWRDAGVAFCGAAIYTVALILAAFILKFFGIDLIDIVKKVAAT